MRKGFTMIELLVVIAIIGILASFAIVSFTSSQKQARDTTRKSDARQYQTLLEAYASRYNGTYPSRTASTDITNLCATLDVTGSCPTDPKAPTDIYRYISNGTGGVATDATEYVIWASLEAQTNYWVVCSNGTVGTNPTSPTTSTCPI
jgi:prepilin-type N-terminal cleavage/methylation domain-containing protein